MKVKRSARGHLPGWLGAVEYKGAFEIQKIEFYRR